MKDFSVRSLSDFVNRISEIRAEWALPANKELWFRGEPQKYETYLRPKLYRPPKGRLLKPSIELLEIENDLYEYFQHSGTSLCETPIDESNRDWDWYFLMQHHGAPTRLLDWSDGALIALHFAVREEREQSDADPVVYALEPDHLQNEIRALLEINSVKEQWSGYVKKHPSYLNDESEWEDVWLPNDELDRTELNSPSMPLLLEFPHITRRVAAQRSRFIVFGTDPDWLANRLTVGHSYLREYQVDASSVARIKAELRDAGITESVVFPDLDGLGREVAQLWIERR